VRGGTRRRVVGKRRTPFLVELPGM